MKKFKFFGQIKFIKKYEAESFSVLFFCRNGTQRSATCLALFLLSIYNLDASDIIKKKRKMALKPFLFKNCLNEYKKKIPLYLFKEKNYLIDIYRKYNLKKKKMLLKLLSSTESILRKESSLSLVVGLRFLLNIKKITIS